MENKLLDSYSASGTDAKSFISEMRDLAARTSYPFVDPSDVFLLSYHKTEDKPIKDSTDIKRIYYFYKLDRTNLSRLVDHNNGIMDVPFVVTIKKGIKSANCEFFEEVIKNSGLMIAYNDEDGNTHYNGVSGYGVITLCKKADAKGERLHEKSLFRDMFIADGILPKHYDELDDEANRRNDRLISDGFKMVVRHNIKTNDKGELVRTGFGIVVGVFSGTYNEAGMMALVDLYKLINEDKTLGKAKLTHWESNQGYSSVTIEFPEAAKSFQEKYNLPVKLVPGIKMTSSDCGLSSLVVSGTYRVDGTDSTIIVNEYSRKHSGKIVISNIMDVVKETIIQKLESFAEAVSNLTKKTLGDFDLTTEQGKQRNREAIKVAINNGFTKLSLNRILGQKRSTLVKKYMFDSADESMAYTYYDMAEMFLHLETYIYRTDGTTTLGKTARDCLIRELANIIDVDFTKNQKTFEERDSKKETKKTAAKKPAAKKQIVKKATKAKKTAATKKTTRRKTVAKGAV